MDLALSGKIALVTGASRGIGRAAATALAAEGAHVILVARTVGGLEEVDDEIRKHGGAATLVPLDLGILPQSTASERRSTNAGAVSMHCSATPACLAR